VQSVLFNIINNNIRYAYPGTGISSRSTVS